MSSSSSDDSGERSGCGAIIPPVLPSDTTDTNVEANRVVVEITILSSSSSTSSDDADDLEEEEGERHCEESRLSPILSPNVDSDNPLQTIPRLSLGAISADSLSHIFSFLPGLDLYMQGSVSRLFRSVSLMPHLWKSVLREDPSNRIWIRRKTEEELAIDEMEEEGEALVPFCRFLFCRPYDENPFCFCCSEDCLDTTRVEARRKIMHLRNDIDEETKKKTTIPRHLTRVQVGVFDCALPRDTFSHQRTKSEMGQLWKNHGPFQRARIARVLVEEKRKDKKAKKTIEELEEKMKEGFDLLGDLRNDDDDGEFVREFSEALLGRLACVVEDGDEETRAMVAWFRETDFFVTDRGIWAFFHLIAVSLSRKLRRRRLSDREHFERLYGPPYVSEHNDIGSEESPSEYLPCGSGALLAVRCLFLCFAPMIALLSLLVLLGLFVFGDVFPDDGFSAFLPIFFLVPFLCCGFGYCGNAIFEFCVVPACCLYRLRRPLPLVCFSPSFSRRLVSSGHDHFYSLPHPMMEFYPFLHYFMTWFGTVFVGVAASVCLFVTYGMAVIAIPLSCLALFACLSLTYVLFSCTTFARTHEHKSGSNQPVYSLPIAWILFSLFVILVVIAAFLFQSTPVPDPAKISVSILLVALTVISVIVAVSATCFIAFMRGCGMNPKFVGAKEGAPSSIRIGKHVLYNECRQLYMRTENPNPHEGLEGWTGADDDAVPEPQRPRPGCWYCCWVWRYCCCNIFYALFTLNQCGQEFELHPDFNCLQCCCCCWCYSNRARLCLSKLCCSCCRLGHLLISCCLCCCSRTCRECDHCWSNTCNCSFSPECCGHGCYSLANDTAEVYHEVQTFPDAAAWCTSRWMKIYEDQPSTFRCCKCLGSCDPPPHLCATLVAQMWILPGAIFTFLFLGLALVFLPPTIVPLWAGLLCFMAFIALVLILFSVVWFVCISRRANQCLEKLWMCLSNPWHTPCWISPPETSTVEEGEDVIVEIQLDTRSPKERWSAENQDMFEDDGRLHFAMMTDVFRDNLDLAEEPSKGL